MPLLLTLPGSILPSAIQKRHIERPYSALHPAKRAIQKVPDKQVSHKDLAVRHAGIVPCRNQSLEALGSKCLMPSKIVILSLPT